MPEKTPWLYDNRVRRYRDPHTGRFISPKTVDALRDSYIDGQRQRVIGLTDQLVDGRINLQRWELEMRQLIKETYISEYSAAKGGAANVSQAEWGRIGNLLRKQYEYLDGFARDIAAGKLSPGQVNTRAKLYIESASQVFERGKAEAHGIMLPAYPGDGNTQCLSNCRCSWSIIAKPHSVEATWELGEAEHCPDCVINAQRWNPLVIPT